MAKGKPCKNPACSEYPYYGVAPHVCYFRMGKKIGQSKMLPRSKWPRNFLPEEGGKCGVYYCPTCLYGMPPKPKRRGKR